MYATYIDSLVSLNNIGICGTSLHTYYPPYLSYVLSMSILNGLTYNQKCLYENEEFSGYKYSVILLLVKRL